MTTTTAPSGFARAPQIPSTLSAADLEKIREYQKITEFRDTILAGRHPRIKVPATSTQGKSVAIPPTQPNASPIAEGASSSTQTLRSVAAVNGYQKENMQSFKTNSQQPAIAAPGASSSLVPDTSKALVAGKAEIDPILLEKSDDLIKAEIQLQRQRLEKSLRDQIEERRAAMKATLQQPESLKDLDLSDILAKALTVVQATAPPITSDANVAANNTDSSDSFDENTFYSSQHDTPELTASPRGQDASPDVQMQDTHGSPAQNDAYSPTLQFNPQPLSITTPQSQQAHGGHSAPLVPGASSARQHPQSNEASVNEPTKQVAAATQLSHTGGAPVLFRPPDRRDAIDAQVISSEESGAASRSGDSGNTDSDQPTDSNRTQNLRPLPHIADLRPREPPVVRAHDLSPYAPQPAHVSPLATAHQPPIPQPDISVLQAAPAPVTALRQQQHTVTSPESSPQGDKGGRKKNKKKNKRKPEGRTHTAPGSPDIKPEPRSPSPPSAPQFARPPKRQRPLQRQAEEPAYDESIIERSISRVQREYRAPVPVQEERLPYAWERVEEPYARQLRYSVAPASQRPEHVVYEDRRPERVVYEERRLGDASVQYVRRIQSPPGYPVPHGASDARPMRSASYSVAQPVYGETSAYPSNGRTSVRPYPNRARSRSPVMTEGRSPFMGPPTAAPTRVVLDQYGRQYIEPPRASTTIRHFPAMPGNGPGEPEIIYERAPMPAASRMSGVDTFEQDGVIYRRASPAVASRRVVTQPDYPGAEYRSYRERDYPIQHAREPPPEFVPYRGAADRRVPEDYAREYIPRTASVRPAETVPYHGRLQSTRPEIAPREYASSVHPEARREPTRPVIREYSVRPTEAELPRREFSVRPAEGYYDRPLPRDEEVTYIERPRVAQPEIVYADDLRGQIYRQHG
ncbi:hypothetical protein DL769_006435 [Monosporascus sp. CRB-8-3]|nr:hypothetical protein DL769_006435 [Monosporascus sp. CRB-8-3]